MQLYHGKRKALHYGEMLLPQSASSKVKKRQDVLIKVRSYPYQEYGYLCAKVDYIADIPTKDSMFFAKAVITRQSQDSLIKLKPGTYADAEIPTDNQSILKRIWVNVTKAVKV